MKETIDDKIKAWDEQAKKNPWNPKVRMPRRPTSSIRKSKHFKKNHELYMKLLEIASSS